MNNVFIYFSDLHLEMIHRQERQWTFIFDEVEKVKAENPNSRIHILAAGDISSPTQQYTYDLFTKLCSQVENVFYCFGNHEYYEQNIMTVMEEFKKNFSDNISNLHVMENEMFEDSDFIVLSSVLWTNFNNGDFGAMATAEEFMNDYVYIYKDDDRSTPIRAIDTMGLNTQSESFLFEKIKQYENDERPVIVMTHHSPVNTKDKSLFGLDFAFQNEYENKLSYEVAPDYWIFGHTHQIFDMEVAGCKILSNAFGYLKENNERRLKHFTV